MAVPEQLDNVEKPPPLPTRDTSLRKQLPTPIRVSVSAHQLTTNSNEADRSLPDRELPQLPRDNSLEKVNEMDGDEIGSDSDDSNDSIESAGSLDPNDISPDQVEFDQFDPNAKLPPPPIEKASNGDVHSNRDG